MQHITLTGPRTYDERPKLWERIGAGSAELEAIRKFMLKQLNAPVTTPVPPTSNVSTAPVAHRSGNDSAFADLAPSHRLPPSVDARPSRPVAAHDVPEVSRRIRSADDILALWYLRCDLYQAILNTEGEEMAAEKLQPVTHQFVGLIPSPLRPRSTTLGGMPAANVDDYLKASEE